ncbi:hypothetical protein Tco_1416924 [Tanacetum coccineum]
MSTTNKESRPHAAASFMANLMQTGPSTGQGTSNDTDFHSEIHGGEQLDSDVDSVIDDHDNTIPYHQYQLNNEVESIEDNLFKEVSEYMKIFDELDKEYDQCVIDKKSLEIENKNLLIQNECLLAESMSKDICSVELELKSQKYKECFENPQVCNNSSSPELNVYFEINKFKDHIKRKDELLRKLKAQIGNMNEVSANPNLSTLEFQALETKNTQLKVELTAVRIKNASLRDENVSIKKRYQDLYQSKVESNSNVHTRAVVPEKPKVLAPGLYAMTPKYVPP